MDVESSLDDIGCDVWILVNALSFYWRIGFGLTCLFCLLRLVKSLIGG